MQCCLRRFALLHSNPKLLRHRLVVLLIPTQPCLLLRFTQGGLCFSSFLFETVECLRFVLVNVENCQKFRYGEKVLKFLRQVEKFQLASIFVDGGEARNQFTDAAGVDVSNASEVQQNPLLTFFKQPANSRSQRDAALTNRDLAAHVKNGYVTSLTFRDVQLSHFRVLLYACGRLTSLEHPHCSTASWSNRPGNFIHKSAHEKDSAPRSFQNVLFFCWIWDFFRPKTMTLIVNRNFNCLWRALQGEFHCFPLILCVAMYNRVRDSLAHSHVDPKSCVFRDPRATHKVGYGVGGFRNRLDAAG